MEVKASHKFARISPRKTRLVANQVRGHSVSSALNILSFSPKKAAYLIKKVLESSIANAENNNGLDIDELWISKIFIDEGPRLKRWHARAKGSSTRIIKRSCHISVVVSDDKRKK